MDETRGRMLFISPNFFGYYQDIIEALRGFGYQADWYSDKPASGNLFKAVARVKPSLVKAPVRKYFGTMLAEVSGKRYDMVFVLAGMTFSFDGEMVAQLRSAQPQAEFVLYVWDSEENLPFVRGLYRFFDRIYTFERADALKNPVLKHLPLFFVDAYETAKGQQAGDLAYDLFYAGTAHPKKFREINRMADALKDVWPRQYIYHYMPSMLKYLYHRVLAPEYRHAFPGDFRYQKLSRQEIVQLLARSGCVLDSAQAGQTGLTIRLIECLGAGRKVITTNQDVRHYDFYRPENIYVYDGRFCLEDVFFHSGYAPVPDEVYRKYSIHHWAGVIAGRSGL